MTRGWTKHFQLVTYLRERDVRNVKVLRYDDHRFLPNLTIERFSVVAFVHASNQNLYDPRKRNGWHRMTTHAIHQLLAEDRPHKPHDLLFEKNLPNLFVRPVLLVQVLVLD